MPNPSYNLPLVAASVLLAVLCGYVAFGVAMRMAASGGALRRGWLAAGALVLGWGIWAMHFVGMLAWRMNMPLGFAPLPTALSIVPAVFGAGVALNMAARGPLHGWRLWLAGASLGGGVGAMHYLGMTALEMAPPLIWNPAIVLLSLVYALLGATLTLWVSQRLLGARRPRAHRVWLASVLLGCTVAGMHYLGMAAAKVSSGSICTSADSPLRGQMLGLTIAIATAVLLGGTWLAARLHAALERQRRAAERALRMTRQQLAFRSLQDELTGLPNRAMFERYLETQLARTRLARQPLAVLLLRVTGIERLRQALGGRGGDAALSTVARTLERCLRGRAVLARVGESSFAVACSEIGDAAALDALAHELLHCLRQPVEVLDLRGTLDATAGIAVTPLDGESAEQLLQHATAAQRNAALTGSDVQRYRREHQRGVHQRIALAADLREAIAADQLDVHYQMLWDVRTQRPRGAEALARWQHPQRGWIAPGEFIPLAEQDGSARDLDWCILGGVLRQLAAWDAQGIEPGSIAVNVSAASFGRDDFVPRLREACAAHVIAPTRLRFELTEAMAMADSSRVRANMVQLREMGCCLLLDDFGTGYSSLRQLRELPLTALKIDQSFVRGAEHDPADRAIVEAVVVLAQKLRLGTIAEGVEHAQQASWLGGLGVDALQGYLYARPEPAARYATLLQEHAPPRICTAPVWLPS